MSLALQTVAAVLIAYGIARGMGERLAAASTVTARNYRGLELPTACGLALVLATGAALAGAVVLGAIAPRGRFPDVLAAVLLGAGAVFGYGLLGLWDDVSTDEGRGWAVHVRALREGTASGGAVKLGGGLTLGIILAAAFGGSLWVILMRGALIAMAANLVNLLDVRPGRALKFSLLLGLGPLLAALVMADRAAIPVAAVLAAGLALLPLDLRERIMLGDVGANAVGAVLGVATVAVATTPVQLGLLAALLGLHLVADRPGLSALITHVRPLAALDRAGRVSELPDDADGAAGAGPPEVLV